MPKPPKVIPQAARALWRKLSPSVPESKKELLIAYCLAFNELLLATKELDETGRSTVAGNGTQCIAPGVQRQRQALSAMNQLSQRLALDKCKATEKDDLESFLETR